MKVSAAKARAHIRHAYYAVGEGGEKHAGGEVKGSSGPAEANALPPIPFLPLAYLLDGAQMRTWARGPLLRPIRVGATARSSPKQSMPGEPLPGTGRINSLE